MLEQEYNLQNDSNKTKNILSYKNDPENLNIKF